MYGHPCCIVINVSRDSVPLCKIKHWDSQTYDDIIGF